MAFLEYGWLIPALPFLAAVAITLFGLKTPEKGGWIATLLVALAGVLSLGVFYEGLKLNPVSWENPAMPLNVEWWSAGEYVLNMGVYVDPLTIFMLFTVGILVTLIALYSTWYMHEEGTARRRYYAELTLFITGMLGLVVASNYLMLFIFWEIMGLCSYLLIGFWFNKASAASAAKKAFLTTRVGDAFFMVGLAILFVQFKTLDFNALFAAAAEGAPGVDRGALLLGNACILMGAVGKSAQVPLHTWLPDAMEGPTTVSALIHAATMVKAGVYLVARSYPLFVLTPEVLLAVAIIGGVTAIFAASLALTNWDLKRVLAYSTLSQLGYMFLGLGVAGALFYAPGHPEAALVATALTGVTVAIFHLFSHAFFKAGLFLSAGSVGHALHSYDMRIMGGLGKKMPVTAFAMLMGTISIAGIPPFSGFFSKDAIMHEVFLAAQETGAIVYWVLYALAVITAAMTAYYMFRLYFLTFTGRFRGWEFMEQKDAGFQARYPNTSRAAPSADAQAILTHGSQHGDEGTHPHRAHDDEHGDAHGHHGMHLHDGNWAMKVPLAILGTFAIIGGIVAIAIAGGSFGGFIHASHGTVEAAAAGVPGVTVEAVEAVHESHVHHGLVGVLLEPFAAITTYVSIAAALVGIGLAAAKWRPAVVESNITTDRDRKGLRELWANRYYIDKVYDAVFGRAVLALGAMSSWFDANIIDGVVNGVADTNVYAANRVRRWNTGFVQDYALTVLGGFILIVLLVILIPQMPDLWARVSSFVPSYIGGGF